MRRVNLIPADRQKTSRLTTQPFIRIFIGLVMVFFLIVFWQTTAIFRYHINIEAQKKEIKTLQVKASKDQLFYEGIKEHRDKVNEARKKVVKRLALLQESRKQGVVWSNVLNDLGEFMPDEIWLYKMSLSEEEMILSGRSTSNKVVSQFMTQLDNAKYFQGTNFHYLQKAHQFEQSLVDFEVVTNLIGEQIKKGK